MVWLLQKRVEQVAHKGKQINNINNNKNTLGPRNSTVRSLLKTRTSQSTSQHSMGITPETSQSTELLLTVDGLRKGD